MRPVDLGVTYVHYERLMGLDRQRSEAFGPVHYEGYIWHWSTRQPIALHCWVPAAPDVRWLPGPQSFNRAGIVSYSNSWAFGFLSEKKQKNALAHMFLHTQTGWRKRSSDRCHPPYTLQVSDEVWRSDSSTNKHKHVGMWLLCWA